MRGQEWEKTGGFCRGHHFVKAPRDLPKMEKSAMALWSLPEADTDGKQNTLLLGHIGLMWYQVTCKSRKAPFEFL